MAKTYVTATDRDILVLAPEKDKAQLPDEQTAIRWLQAVEAEDLKPYKEEVNTQPFLSSEPVPGKITDSAFNQELNITRLTLSNGIKVVLKPTDFKNDQIVFSAFSPGGTSLYPDVDYPSAASAAGA